MDIMAILEALHQKNVKMQDEGYGNLAGFQKMVSGSTDTAKNYADGGMVDKDFINQLNAGTVPGMEAPAPTPDISAFTAKLNQTPNTNYDFYKNISAEDRANLAKQLMQQQHSAPQLMGEGLAGIGDAIRNSYGGQTGAHGMKDIQERGQKNTDDQLSAFDTNRSQRLQDMQGSQEMQMNDPNSPLSQALRQAAKAAGLNVASGMSANVLIKVIPGFGDLANKQTQLMIQQAQAAETRRHDAADEAHASAALAQAKSEKEDTYKRDNLALLSKQGPIDTLMHPEVSKAAREGAGLSGPNPYAAELERRRTKGK